MRVAAALVLVILATGELASVTPSAVQPQASSSKRADPADKAKPDRFAVLRAFEGRWRGEGTGQPGQSTVGRTYEFVLRDKYLNVRNLSVYLPQEKNPKGEKHEDWGMFSYDGQRKKLVLRQFHVEGFVNQYVLDRASDDGKEMVFVSDAIENVPAGYRARETYRFTRPDVFEETFELAKPGKDFEVYVKTKFTRQNEQSAGKGEGKPLAVQIKFQLGGPSKPVVVVPVLVNGEGPYLFALDTGAGQTVVSSEVAKELALDQGEKKEALGAGGKVSVSLSKVKSIAVESAKLENLPIVITDLSLLRLAVGGKLDGILGYNYLKNFKVTIDYAEGKLSLE